MALLFTLQSGCWSRTRPGRTAGPRSRWTLEEPAIAAGQLLAIGVHVEVVSPPAVREAFAETVRRMAERHR